MQLFLKAAGGDMPAHQLPITFISLAPIDASASHAIAIRGQSVSICRFRSTVKKAVELDSGLSQKLPILGTRPTHFGNGSN
jgi:hypothetical protein